MKEKKPFNYSDHITKSVPEIRQIVDYADSRNIDISSYDPGFFWTKNDHDDGFTRHLAMAFPHTNRYGEIIGVKLRNIDPSSETRYRAKGSLMYYYLEGTAGWSVSRLFIIEGEINAASAEAFFKYAGYASSIISFGGVADVPVSLPKGFADIYIVIDHDGDEELYQERLKLYEHFEGTPIKLNLARGEDINSLWCESEFGTLKKLLK